MVMHLFNTDGAISFDPDKHIYRSSSDHGELTSVSRVLNSIEVPFDREGISKRMAKGDPVKQEAILAEWEEAKNSSILRGNMIHQALEDYILKGEKKEFISNCYPVIDIIIKEAARYYPEALVYSDYYKIAGQSDLVIQRQNSKNSLFDFYDYKTNESKGIEYDSISRKKDPPTHYNRFFLPPLDHLESCNYIRYAIQLSSYAYLAESTWGIKVGKLAILFVDLNNDMHEIPVPYMKLEVMALFDHHKNLKQLPGVKGKYDFE